MVARMHVQGPAIFGVIIWAAFVRFCVPVLGVFYGTSLIADEVEDKTITYLFTRPIPRGAVLLGKYIAYLACTLCVVLPSVVLVWLLVVPVGGGGLGANFPDLVKDLILIGLGLAVYGALFALIGCTLKRPLLFGLVFIFGWETIALTIPGYLKRFTVAYYVQGLVPHAMPSDSAVSLIQEIVRETPTLAQSLFWMGAIEVACIWLAARAITRREYVLEQ
jgi:ABC-type transport system involved in multi-copper enzyme maturation permease subunit